MRLANVDAMNTPFAIGEVITALKALHNNKSGGVDGVPAEAFKYARREVENKTEFVLAPHLLKLMEHIRATGDYPRQFEISSITPIHKKGDVQEMGNYRGLAVGGALSKLYAFLLERRLSTWGESSGARSPYQGGFRSKRGTCHNLFVLRHLTDKSKCDTGKPLLVCQVDFEKAFDKVPRELLWMRLEERGVTGATLDALKACYQRVELKVNVNRVLGDSFLSFQGVKQGCPMSPTLYGIFGEGFADYVEAKDHLAPDAMAAHDCPISDDVRIPLKLYADDLSLFAASHRRLMALLRSLREWCEAFGMSMNAGKCDVLYFHSDQVTCKAMYTLGEYGLVPIMVKERGVQVMKSLPWKDRARYLGLHYGPGTTFE